MTTTANTVRYDFYMRELHRAENPHAILAGLAVGIGKCKEYTKTEKGRALETLTAAWTDFTENR